MRTHKLGASERIGPRVYGRCMSKREAKELKGSGILNDHGNGQVLVFDAPGYVQGELARMDGSGRRDYFKRIGVRDPKVIAFFEVDGGFSIPAPRQTNGLSACYLPEGTPVKYLGRINC